MSEPFLDTSDLEYGSNNSPHFSLDMSSGHDFPPTRFVRLTDWTRQWRRGQDRLEDPDILMTDFSPRRDTHRFPILTRLSTEPFTKEYGPQGVEFRVERDEGLKWP